MQAHEALADRFFAATASGDAAALQAVCAPDFKGQQNSGPSMSIAVLLRFTLAVHQVAKNFRYEERRLSPTAKGFVEEHDVVCDLADGPFRLPVCVVAEVANDRIVAMREYLDSAVAGRLIQALG